MPGILEDKDRIFTNLYGLHDWGLEGAMRRGCWNGVKDIVAQTPASMLTTNMVTRRRFIISRSTLMPAPSGPCPAGSGS